MLDKVKKIAEAGICTSAPCGEVWISDDAIQQIYQLFEPEPDGTINYGPGGKGANTYGPKPDELLKLFESEEGG